MEVSYRTYTNSGGGLVGQDKLDKDEQDQPSKYGQQKEDLRNGFHEDIVVLLEMAAEVEGGV